MKKKQEFKFEFESYTSLNDLSLEDQRLLYAAVETAEDAYAPYSNFRVGAAVMLANGEEVRGSNQENAAYPSGLCAERVALFFASANYPNEKMKTLAIYTADLAKKEELLTPCGACRQVMNEYESRQSDDIRLLIMNSAGAIWLFKSTQYLLPFAFNSHQLKK